MTISQGHIDGDRVQTPKSRGSGSDSAGKTDSGMRVIRMSRNPRGPVLDSVESEIEMMAHDSNPMDDDAVCKRYVVLVAPGEQLPPPLMELLADRADTSTTTNVFKADHPTIAIGQLARLERERRLQEKWELAEQTVLVVVNRDSWKDLSGLFDATRQIMPSVAIWVCAERIAIQIYAGETDTDILEEALEDQLEPHVPEPQIEEPVLDDRNSEEPERTTLSSEELQDLLGAFGDFEDETEEKRNPEEDGRDPGSQEPEQP